MKILFCEDTINHNAVDEAFLQEYENAISNGFDVILYNFDEKSSKKIETNNKTETVIYRGWMINPFDYKNLYEDLLLKNYKLINNPIQYKNCHYLPESIKYIENYTPKTIFQKIENEESINILIEKAKIFNGRPVIVKDYVKSEKHYWDTACFVENSNNINKLTNTINNLIKLRENDLNEGIVIREYIELNNLTKHSKSGMPLSEEYRMYFYKNELLCIFNYWEEGNYIIKKPDTKSFEENEKTIDNNFFTMDIAKEKGGNYIIIELGDGQVSGIPEKEDKYSFYKNIKERQTSA
jgi:hypothetical protein